MQKYKRTINFDKEWKSFYKIIKQINIDVKNNSIDTYSYSLYDRTLYLLDAYIQIEKTNNISVMTILLRCLFEIKIKASNIQDDKNKEISNINIEIKQELEKFLIKIKNGDSYTSQILSDLLKDKEFNFTTKDGKETLKRRTIRDRAKDADLEFDYEILYWISSLFIHSHPLSLFIEQKEKYPNNEIIDVLSYLIQDIDLLNINFLTTILWISTYLFEDIFSKTTKQEIDNLWDISRKLLIKKSNLKWEIDENINLGEMQIITKEKTVILKRNQSK